MLINDSIIAPIVVGTVLLRAGTTANDRLFAAWPVAICTITTHGLSVIIACGLFVKPFLEALDTGADRAEDARWNSISGSLPTSRASSGQQLLTADHRLWKIVAKEKTTHLVTLPLGQGRP